MLLKIDTQASLKNFPTNVTEKVILKRYSKSDPRKVFKNDPQALLKFYQQTLLKVTHN